MKKNFESNCLIDRKKYNEFVSSFRLSSFFFMLNTYASLSLVIGFIDKRYFETIFICVFQLIIIFIAEIILRLKENFKSNYKKNLNEREFVLNKVKINDNGIEENVDNDKILKYSFDSYYGIIETENLLILKVSFRLGIILDKNNLVGGTKEDLIKYLYSKFPNMSNKKVIKNKLINSFIFHVIITLILLIVTIVLRFYYS